MGAAPPEAFARLLSLDRGFKRGPALSVVPHAVEAEGESWRAGQFRLGLLAPNPCQALFQQWHGLLPGFQAGSSQVLHLENVFPHTVPRVLGDAPGGQSQLLEAAVCHRAARLELVPAGAESPLENASVAFFKLAKLGAKLLKEAQKNDFWRDCEIPSAGCRSLLRSATGC